MLRISKLTDYATVLMASLAREPVGTCLPASQLADQTRLEQPTVAKVLKTLARSGLVQSVRGVNGGYRLNAPAEEISVAAIVRAMEGPIALTECGLEPGLCSHESNCSCAATGSASAWPSSRPWKGSTWPIWPARPALPSPPGLPWQPTHLQRKAHEPDRRTSQPGHPAALQGRFLHRYRIRPGSGRAGRGNRGHDLGQEERAGLAAGMAPQGLPSLADHAHARTGPT
jgi:FeS assembly SUF system regulator